jgi:hypothetical protein
MKKLAITLLLLAGLQLGTNGVHAQTAPPPPGDHSLSSDESPGGGSAPIGGGLFILLGLGAAYGSKKLYEHRKETLEE